MTKQELIEDNMKLVYFTINKHYPTFAKDEDLIQIGMVGLCKAANTWDEEKSKFSTYAVKCILTEIQNEIRSRSKQTKTISLESKVFGEEYNDDYHNLLPTENIDFDSDIEYERFKKILTKGEIELWNLLQNGMSQTDIAISQGVTRSWVNAQVRRIRRKWRVYNGKNKD